MDEHQPPRDDPSGDPHREDGEDLAACSGAVRRSPSGFPGGWGNLRPVGVPPAGVDRLRRNRGGH
jgi:hypothetical protein